MDMVPVQSSNITALGHDAETGTLRVQYKSGRHYDYAGMDAKGFDTLLKADSVGKHLYQNVVGILPVTPLDDELKPLRAEKDE